LSRAAQADLPITGMTCGSCAARIERTLNRLPGVEATVNYATERARVAYDPDTVTPDDLVAAVEDVGYHVASTATSTPAAVTAPAPAPPRPRLRPVGPQPGRSPPRPRAPVRPYPGHRRFPCRAGWSRAGAPRGIPWWCGCWWRWCWRLP
jgi:copper chaperone CopZ